jgi:RimJ/RimL family protein N-acetyltransferase
VLQTDRLSLRRLNLADAEFILGLLNEPSWLQYIGDRGVRTLEAARAYVQNGPVAMYDRLGFGLLAIELKGQGVPIGICGLIKRDHLPDVDIGYALLPSYWGRGYAYESAAAVLAHGREVLGLRRIVAITVAENQSSIRVLQKLGMQLEQTVRAPEDGAELLLFA